MNQFIRIIPLRIRLYLVVKFIIFVTFASEISFTCHIINYLFLRLSLLELLANMVKTKAHI